MFWFLVIVN